MREDFCLTGESVTATEPYEYRACGLEGIFLINGVDRHEHDGEEYVAIKDIDGLHIAIGRHLVISRKALAPTEIRFLRKTMDMTQAELAEELGKTSQSVARWEKGAHDIPGSAEKLLRAIFIARCVMSDEDLQLLRDFLAKKMSELDTIDDMGPRPVQFSLTNHWEEKAAA